METLIIILITLIFGLIFFNIVNNKKFSIFSFLMFISICLFYYLKYTENKIYLVINDAITNLQLWKALFIVLTFIISIVEYVISYKANIKCKNNNDVNKEKSNKEMNNIIDFDILNVYINMFSEPIALLINNEYTLNNEMKKVLKYNSSTIDQKKLASFVHNADKNIFLSSSNIQNFRMNINGNYEWFEITNYQDEKKKFSLIKKINYEYMNSLNLKSFKEMMNILDTLEYEKKDYYLIFFNINNYSDLNSFYGNDFTDLVINKHLNRINNLPYVNSERIYYISKNEYALLIDNILEYNILLSELENDSSILLKNDIIISDNKIGVRGKVGTIASSDVKNKNSSYILNKCLELLKLACDEDYNLDYAIFHEGDMEVDYILKDLDIDLNFDFSKYKKRLQ